METKILVEQRMRKYGDMPLESVCALFGDRTKSSIRFSLRKWGYAIYLERVYFANDERIPKTTEEELKVKIEKLLEGKQKVNTLRVRKVIAENNFNFRHYRDLLERLGFFEDKGDVRRLEDFKLTSNHYKSEKKMAIHLLRTQDKNGYTDQQIASFTNLKTSELWQLKQQNQLQLQEKKM